MPHPPYDRRATANNDSPQYFWWVPCSGHLLSHAVATVALLIILATVVGWLLLA